MATRSLAGWGVRVALQRSLCCIALAVVGRQLCHKLVVCAKCGRLRKIFEWACFQIVRASQKFEMRCRPKRIFVLRHGQSEGNVDKSLFERKPDNDHCLTEIGRLQAIQAGRKLRRETKDEPVYFQVSPYRRTRETLEAILMAFMDEDGNSIPWDEFQRMEALRRIEEEEEEDLPVMARYISDASECQSKFTSGTSGASGANSPLGNVARAKAPLCYLRVRSKSLESLLSPIPQAGNIFCWPRNDQYKVREDARLREQEFGNYQKGDHMTKSFAERRSFGPFWYRFDHGESGGDVFDRISDWWSSMLREFARHGGGHEFPNYVVVTHGLTMRCLFMYYFKWSVEEFNKILNPDNCEAWELNRTPEFQYVMTSHPKFVDGMTMPSHMRTCHQ